MFVIFKDMSVTHIIEHIQVDILRLFLPFTVLEMSLINFFINLALLSLDVTTV